MNPFKKSKPGATGSLYAPQRPCKNVYIKPNVLNSKPSGTHKNAEGNTEVYHIFNRTLYVVSGNKPFSTTWWLLFFITCSHFLVTWSKNSTSKLEKVFHEHIVTLSFIKSSILELNSYRVLFKSDGKEIFRKYDVTLISVKFPGSGKVQTVIFSLFEYPAIGIDPLLDTGNVLT